MVRDAAGSEADVPVPPAPDLRVLDGLARIAAVERLVALGPLGDRVQDLTSLAARLLGTAHAQVSLLGGEDQFVAAVHGMDLPAHERRSPRSQSLCTYTAASGRPLVIGDARNHPWVQHLPPVTSGVVAAYLGVLLTDADGHALGSLCVYDGSPRAWDVRDVAALDAVAQSVVDDLARHSHVLDSRAEAVRLQMAVSAADLGSYDLDLQTRTAQWDDRMLALHDLRPETFTGALDVVLDLLHPEDLPAVKQAMAHAVETLGDLVIDYRVTDGTGRERWINARGRVLPDMFGAPARIVGAAYDSSAERGLREELNRIMDTMPAAFVRLDRAWRITYLNAQGEALVGQSRHLLTGRDHWEAFPDAAGTDLERHYRQAMATGEKQVVEAFFEPLDTPFELHLWPDAQGLSIFFQDISARTRARLAMTRATERLEVLARASDRLSASISADDVLAVLQDLVVPDLAEGVSLDLDGDLGDHVGQLAHEPRPAGPTDAQTHTRVLRSPAGRFGRVTYTGASGQELDRVLLGELTGRAAVALDRGLAYERERSSAADLQRALLPRELAQVSGVDVATRYLPAREGALAGGDFFKTLTVGGRLVTVLGDVMGHGTASAARAGQLHALVAALVLEGHGPGALLRQLSHGIEQMMDLELATLLVCSYDPATRTLVSASAGHPPPLCAPLVGEPSYLDLEPGPPIGVLATDYPEHTQSIGAGATLVLFSDGLVERREESLTVGLERLRNALAELRIPPEAVADHVLRELGRESGADDDVALLVMCHVADVA